MGLLATNSIKHPTTLELGEDFTGLEPFMRSLPRLTSSGVGTIIHDGRNEIRIIRHGGRDYCVKKFARPNIINRFVYGTLRPSKAMRSFRNAQMLLKLGIGTPTPVGYYNVRGFLGITLRRSYYVSLLSACTMRYDDLFKRHILYVEEVMAAVGHLAAKLHSNGLRHLDFGRGNILFRRDGDGKILLELVDLNRMRRGPVSLRAGCENLKRLPVTPQMRRWMAHAYAADRGFDMQECEELLRKCRLHEPGKVDGKY